MLEDAGGGLAVFDAGLSLDAFFVAFSRVMIAGQGLVRDHPLVAVAANA
jgi:hypothetical protein